MPFLVFLNVDYAVCEDVQKLADKYKLLHRDAIHATLALKYRDGVIVSNDADFDVIEGLRKFF